MTNPAEHPAQGANAAKNEAGPPRLPYEPALPRRYRPKIGLIGCGAITGDHLAAYRDAGLEIAALCDIRRAAAEKRRKEYFPETEVFTDHRKLLRRDEIEVVDIATHTQVRPPLVRDALEAGKHVLSQKPFVLDLDEGEDLVELAEKKGVYLAVNQNGRWAPHFSYARQAVAAGLLGQTTSANMAVHWDHSWVAGTQFEKIKDLILYDFAIHWFDIVRCFFPAQKPLKVYASRARAPGQPVPPPLLAQAGIEFESGLASLAFNGYVPVGQHEYTSLCGTQGSLECRGPNSKQQCLTLHLKAGSWPVELEGVWFPDAFRGTMGELLCSIEEGRPCSLAASDNLNSLALCFAAVASAREGKPKTPGSVRRLPGT